MAGNPVLSALQAYGAYQDITRSNRADDLKEREFNLRERILKNQLLEQDEERELRDWSATKTLIASGHPNWWDFAPKRIVEQITSQVQTDPQYSYLRDPGARSTMIGAINTIKSGLGNPGTMNRESVYESANTLFKPQLMRGFADDGQPALDKKIVGFYPAGDGENMFINLEVTRQDGSKYKAPLTQRRSSDPDDPVKPVTMNHLFDSMMGTEAIINFVDSQMVRLGDKETMKSIQNRAQGRSLETALGGLSPGMPMEEKRRVISGKMLQQGRSPGEIASFISTAIPEDKKYLEREIPVDGDNRKLQKQASLDGGRTWSNIGQPMYADTLKARTVDTTRADEDLKYDRQLVLTEIKDQQKNVYNLRNKIRSYQANIGSEIIETEPFMDGASVKKKITSADISALRQQLAEEEGKLQELYKEARGPAYYRKRTSALGIESDSEGTGSIAASMYTPKHPDTEHVKQAIFGNESGAEKDPYNAPSRAGEDSSGKYQFRPGTWERISKEYTQEMFGTPFVLPQTGPRGAQNQETLATWDIDRHLLSGNVPEEVAVYWQTGDPKSTLTSGTNSQGAQYDVTEYKRKFNERFTKLKAGASKQTALGEEGTAITPANPKQRPTAKAKVSPTEAQELASVGGPPPEVVMEYGKFVKTGLTSKGRPIWQSVDGRHRWVQENEEAAPSSGQVAIPELMNFPGP